MRLGKNVTSTYQFTGFIGAISLGTPMVSGDPAGLRKPPISDSWRTTKAFEKSPVDGDFFYAERPGTLGQRPGQVSHL
jgi:hypothetical protein